MFHFEKLLMLWKLQSNFVKTLLYISLVFAGADSSESRANATTSLVRGLMKHYEASTEPFLLPLQENLGPVEVNISWLQTNILKFVSLQTISIENNVIK